MPCDVSLRLLLRYFYLTPPLPFPSRSHTLRPTNLFRASEQKQITLPSQIGMKAGEDDEEDRDKDGLMIWEKGMSEGRE